MSGFKVVIPARYGSTRLPGKPLRVLAGKPMVLHVCDRAAASGADDVVVATDDERIVAEVRDAGFEALMTAADHTSGTDRIAEVAETRGWPDEAVVVNLQGDEPLMPPMLVRRVAQDLALHPDASVATVATPFADRRALFDPNQVKVVLNADGFAGYFSRAPIPWHRDEFAGSGSVLPAGTPFLRHVGLYAYRVGFLHRFMGWEPAPTECAESLEQLRALWHGERIHVSVTDDPPPAGVDTPEDVARIELVLQDQSRG